LVTWGAVVITAPYFLAAGFYDMEKGFNYGGQAVLEGVMMRGPRHVVTAVRRPDGEIVYQSEPLRGIYTSTWRKVPLARGVIVLLEAMLLGVKSLLFSANVALEEETGETVSQWYLWGMVAVSLVFSVALFFLLPLFLTRLIPLGQNTFLFMLLEGLIRIAIFILYLRLVTLLPDLKRVFGYHGAEHKSINTYEDGKPLDVINAKEHSRVHYRCGTSFLFVVLVIAVLVFSLVGLPGFWWLLLSRIVLVPVIAAISYEIIFYGSRHCGNPVVKFMLAPGIWLQSLTTREPDDSQLEVGLASLKKLFELEEAAQAEPLPAPKSTSVIS
jgi:uncharacterized protein YqhQ